MEDEINYTDQPGEVSGLIIRIMQQNAKDAAFTTNALLESSNHRIKRLELELECIREDITEMLATGFMPTESRILAALYPAWDRTHID